MPELDKAGFEVFADCDLDGPDRDAVEAFLVLVLDSEPMGLLDMCVYINALSCGPFHVSCANRRVFAVISKGPVWILASLDITGFRSSGCSPGNTASGNDFG